VPLNLDNGGNVAHPAVAGGAEALWVAERDHHPRGADPVREPGVILPRNAGRMGVITATGKARRTVECLHVIDAHVLRRAAE
jgi:hypothetical protein